MREEIEKLNQRNKEKEQQLKSELFCVEIKLPSQQFTIRLTYLNPNSKVLVQVDEINGLNELISSSTVKGKLIKGNLPDTIKNLIPLFRIKPNEWLDNNKELYWDSYYKNH